MDNEIKAMMSYKLDDNLNIPQTSSLLSSYKQSAEGTISQTNNCYTGWGWWRDYYYPQVIKESYPVYITERAVDKGKQAYEIIKMLKDKRFMKLETVADFINAMDALIKVL